MTKSFTRTRSSMALVMLCLAMLSVVSSACLTGCTNDGPAPDCTTNCHNDGDAVACTSFCYNNGAASSCTHNCYNTEAANGCFSNCGGGGDALACTAHCNNTGSAPACQSNCTNGNAPNCASYCANVGDAPTCASYCSNVGPAPVCVSYCSNVGDSPSCKTYCSNKGNAPTCTSYCSNTGEAPLCGSFCTNGVKTAAQCLANPSYAHASWPATLAGQTGAGICASGYMGSPMRKCSSNSTWATLVSPGCTRTFCPLDKISGNATWNPIYSLSIAHGICNSGFVGAPTRACAATGMWSAVQKPCLSAAAHCPLQLSYGNAHWNATLAAHIGTGVCATGFAGTPTRACNYDATWSVNVYAPCIRII